METHYTDGSIQLTGYMACAVDVQPARPGILLIHGGAGLDDHARNRANILASQGYIVHACDMYGDGVAGDRQRIMACLGQLLSNRDNLVRRAQAGVDVLTSDPRCDHRHIAAVGYCFGGMVALELARSGMPQLAAAISIHGSLKAIQPAGKGSVKAKLLVCHGALDPHVPMAPVTAFVDEMNHAEADWQLVIYGGALHGFTHENATNFKDPGVAYNAVADQRSSEAVKVFLHGIFHAQDPALN